MPDVPPKYPRLPHLVPGPGVSADDLVLDGPARERLLAVPVAVEEKLDGANVVLWFDGTEPTVATRGGVDAVARGGQRGRLKAWAAGRADGLRGALGERLVIYAEWLLRRHTVPYERLPGPLAVAGAAEIRPRYVRHADPARMKPTPNAVPWRLQAELSIARPGRGTAGPSIAQLRKLASLYKRPLAVFFLPEPPRGFQALRDFRRLPAAEAEQWSMNLQAAIRRAHFQREVSLELHQALGESPSPPAIGMT